MARSSRGGMRAVDGSSAGPLLFRRDDDVAMAIIFGVGTPSGDAYKNRNFSRIEWVSLDRAIGRMTSRYNISTRVLPK